MRTKVRRWSRRISRVVLESGIVPAEQMLAFRWSSLRRFVRGPRCPGLDPQGALGGRAWTDSPEGWAGYVDHLIATTRNQEEQKRLGYEGFSSGWAIGTPSWRRELAQRNAHLALAPGLAADVPSGGSLRWVQAGMALS